MQIDRRHAPWSSVIGHSVVALAWLLNLSAAAAATKTNTGAAVVVPPKTSAPAVPAQLHDIKGPIEITSWTDWAIRGAIVLAALGLLAAAWWWWRRKRPPAAPPRLVPPDERARERLATALALIEQPERFCTTVSEIARTYLEERFGLKAPERTTEEFLAELPRNAVLESRHKALLSDFLTSTDLVKFARFEPGRRELEELHAAALRLVEETTPRFVPPPLPANSAPKP
jgi:hypothetical protein